jgi:hypothetical protein
VLQTQVWAPYLARQARGRRGRARVCRLPKALRLIQGDIRIPYVGILPPKFHDHVKKGAV